MPGPDSSANAGSVVILSIYQGKDTYCPGACEVADFHSKLQLKHAPAANHKKM